MRQSRVEGSLLLVALAAVALLLACAPRPAWAQGALPSATQPAVSQPAPAQPPSQPDGVASPDSQGKAGHHAGEEHHDEMPIQRYYTIDFFEQPWQQPDQARRIQGMAMRIALLNAALLAVRSWARRRAMAQGSRT